MVVWNQNHKSMRYACMYFLLFHRFTEKRKTTPIPDKLPLWRSHHKSLWIPGPQRISEFCSQIHPSGRSEETVRKWGLETQKWKTGFFFLLSPEKLRELDRWQKGVGGWSYAPPKSDLAGRWLAMTPGAGENGLPGKEGWTSTPSRMGTDGVKLAASSLPPGSVKSGC